MADVTDPGGETRADARLVNLGYTDVEASLSSADWQAVVQGEPAAVPLSIATTTLDGEPRAAAGTLTVHRLVQPDDVDRGDLFGAQPWPGHRGQPATAAKPESNPADPETWEPGEAVFTGKAATEPATGTTIVTARLTVGLYRATFEIPAAGAVPVVKATRIIEVVDPAAEHYGVKRAFVMKAEQSSVEPEAEFRALVGTGYSTGRALV